MTGEPRIHIYPTELWDYCRRNRKLIEDHIVVIADYESQGIEIVIRICDGIHTISTYKGGVLIRDDQIISKEDAMVTCRMVYSRFLTPPGSLSAAPVSGQDDDEEEDEQEDERESDGEYTEDEITEMIDERESALSSAIEDFLAVALEEQADLVTPDELDEILDEFLITLADHGFSIYRPTLIEDDVVYYPYEEPENDSKN